MITSDSHLSSFCGVEKLELSSFRSCIVCLTNWSIPNGHHNEHRTAFPPLHLPQLSYKRYQLKTVTSMHIYLYSNCIPQYITKQPYMHVCVCNHSTQMYSLHSSSFNRSILVEEDHFVIIIDAIDFLYIKCVHYFKQQTIWNVGSSQEKTIQ